MAPTPVKPLTFTVSPTVKEIYEEGEAEFIAAGEIPQMTLLSNENDKVSGLESLYGIILREHHRKLPVSSVTGNEGFMDSVREGFKKIIQAVKDFFKWMWGLFAGKEKAAKDKLAKTEEALNKGGAKSGEIPYPKKAAYVYKKTGKPDNNLHWVKETLVDIIKVADKAIAYVKDAGTLMDAVTNATETSAMARMESLPKELSTNIRALFNLEEHKPGFLLVGNDVILKEGRLTEDSAEYDIKRFMGAKFITTTDELRTLLKDTKEVQKKVDDLGKVIFDLEGTIVKNLQKAIAVTGKAEGDKQFAEKAGAAVKEAIRDTMANLKFIQSTLFWSLGSVSAIISVATA